jgi:ABC-type antimicrobial peptide transport system permease subunit
MNPGEVLRTALGEIRHHVLRSILTLLGIILGTMSITMMTSFLDGIVGTVWEGFADLGYDGVMYVVTREPRDLRETAIFTRSRGLQPEDADALLARRRLVSAVAPVLYDEQVVRRGDQERRARIIGTTPAYAVVRDRALEAGRFLNDFDDRSFARVCVLGHRLCRRLFGSEDPIGKSITVGGRRLRVVGVTERLGNQFVNDSDFIEEMDGLYLPLRTMRKFYTGEESPLSFLAVQTEDVENLADLKAEIRASLLAAHRGAEDFRVENIAEGILRARKEIQEVLTNWRIVLGSIAGISLLVGGIGLMSVMLISIGERLYEIGLRKALGATDLQVFLQFLAESVVLSALGGLLGVAAGVGMITAFARFFPSGLPINLDGLTFAIAVALLLGVLYGVYPALMASRMEPVEALRSSA